MPGVLGRPRLRLGRATMAVGLIASATLMAVVGGRSGLVLGTVQVVCGVVVALRLESPRPAGWAVLALVPGPLAAARHWTARLPGSCRCARLPHPPGLVSMTGLAVLLDVAVLGLAIWLVAASQAAKVEKSSP